jgi:hypothetical protein
LQMQRDDLLDVVSESEHVEVRAGSCARSIFQQCIAEPEHLPEQR